ncbi:hypothetical protein QTN25_002284 [Entamoeba marina]
MGLNKLFPEFGFLDAEDVTLSGLPKSEGESVLSVFEELNFLVEAVLRPGLKSLLFKFEVIPEGSDEEVLFMYEIMYDQFIEVVVNKMNTRQTKYENTYYIINQQDKEMIGLIKWNCEKKYKILVNSVINNNGEKNICSKEIVYDKNGYNRDGYNNHGYDKYGYDINGYDSGGYYKFGFNPTI